MRMRRRPTPHPDAFHPVRRFALRPRRAALAALALCLAGLANAQAAASGDTDLLERLRTRYPATTIQRVQAAPIEGLFEVVMGRQIAYTDRQGQYLLFGSIYDVARGTDLTAQAREAYAAANPVRFPGQAVGDAITIRRGTGARRVAVFSDPQCPHCRSLEAQLAQLTDVTVHVFLVPLLGPQSSTLATQVWCATDRGRAYQSLMLGGRAPGNRRCDTPLERNLALARTLGVTGTPTLISEDGRRLAGAVGTAQIAAFLAAGATAKAAPAAAAPAVAAPAFAAGGPATAGEPQ